MLRGSSCQLPLGWYNVDDPDSTTPPSDNAIYDLVPADTNELLDCQGPLNNGFCPLAWDNVDPRQLDREMWTPVAFDGSSVLADPNYAGGAIGLALMGDEGLDCSENKYSLYGQNQKNSDGDAWVTALIYASSVSPGSFYLAFEDLPMSEDDWQETGVSGNNGSNEGDFNDWVYFVSVTDCSSGGSGGTGGTNGSAGAAGAAEDSGGATSTGGSAGDGSVASGSYNTTSGATSTGGAATTGTGGATSTGGTAGAATAGAATIGGSTAGSGGSEAGGSDGGDLVCTPGRQIECTCTDGRKGAQVCNPEGDGFSACECSSAPASSDSGGCGCRVGEEDPSRVPWARWHAAIRGRRRHQPPRSRPPVSTRIAYSANPTPNPRCKSEFGSTPARLVMTPWANATISIGNSPKWSTALLISTLFSASESSALRASRVVTLDARISAPTSRTHTASAALGSTPLPISKCCGKISATPATERATAELNPRNVWRFIAPTCVF